MFNIEPGQIYLSHVFNRHYVVVELFKDYPDAWVTFNLEDGYYSWDVAPSFQRQYRRVA